MVKNKPSVIGQLEEIFYKKGQEKSPKVKSDNAQDAYKIINDCLLDGMPCDHVNQSVEAGPDLMIWDQTENIHKKYWDEVEGDIELYQKLRERFMMGTLAGSNLVFESRETNQYSIRREKE
ncbi:MAG: hypothetical protein HGA25_03070 [Clostridiales bacterium]|nr:hypothetical protein [Clostridiales bacterium]